MPPQDTSDSRFALEGFLPLWLIVLLGLALLALSWWMARRDARFADRPRLVSVLFVLRCVAILVLLWMLAGPTLVTSVRKYKTKSIALLVDTSASMGLVDVVDGSGNVSRWAAARNENVSATIRKLDESVAMLRVAQNQLERFSKTPNSTKDTAAARAAFARAVQGIRPGADALKKFADELPDSAADLKRAFNDAARVINENVLDVLQNKSAEFNRGKTLASLERERWLPERLASLTICVAQIEGLADRFLKSMEDAPADSAGKMDPQESKLSRIDKVDSFLAGAEQTWLKDIRKKATVNHYEFGEKVVPLGSAPAIEKPKNQSTGGKPLSGATQIGAALQQVAIDSTTQPVEAAILITDGGHNAGADPRELAASLSGTTLHVVPIGNTKMQRDVILHHTHAPKAVLQNDQVVVDSIVTAYDCENEKLQVELLDNGTVVDRQTINVTTEVFDSRVQLRWKAAQLGKHSLAFRVVPIGDERSEENNATKADVHVMEDKIRVLVADNYPRWETRYLLNLFKRDDRVSFDQLLFEPHSSTGEGVRSHFPASLEEWSKYRIVILGDVLPAQLTYEQQKALREYVTEAGGNLIIVAGKDAMPAAYLNQPLGAMLPVEAGDRAISANNPFYLHLTDEGSMTLATQIAENPGISERLWREMSERLPIYAMSEFSRPKPTTHSLIWASMSKTSFNPGDASTRSFLSWQYVGAGRVVYVAAPITYQLRYRQGDTFHHRFWGQLLRWAVARDLAEGSQTVRLSTDKSRYEHGESVQVSARLRQLDGKVVGAATLQVAALHEGKLVQEITLKEDSTRPGTYHGRLEALPVGPVKLQAIGDRARALLAQENYRRPVETTVTIDPSGVLELRHPLCNLPLLRQVADVSGGIVLPPTGLKAALQALNLDPEVLENVIKKPLWNRWDLFWIFILCLTLEWAGRKYIGLS